MAINPKIMCMGDALIDFKETGRLAFQGFVGGSPLNVAVAAARLGEAVGFASQVSADQFGRAIRAHLQRNGVNTEFLLESDAASTLAFVGEVEGEAVFDFIANRSADVLYDPQPRQSFPETLKMLQFGSISLLQEPAATTLTDTAAAHYERALIVFDPNVRPALIAHKGDFEKRLKRQWLPNSHLVKVSSQDLRWLYPEKAYDEVAADWLEHGPQAVVITDGGDAVTLYRPTRDALSVLAPTVEVVDTVGAGDTFTGALMVALLDKAERGGDVLQLDSLADATWREVLSYAAAAAALNCTRPGADPPTATDLATFRNERGV